jgi:hypothetical protein
VFFAVSSLPYLISDARSHEHQFYTCMFNTDVDIREDLHIKLSCKTILEGEIAQNLMFKKHVVTFPV